MTNQIIGVFTRFHEEKIAFLADVEAMYHQVHVREDQQSFLKLLWSGFPTGVEDMGGSSKFDGGGGGGLSQYMGGGGLKMLSKNTCEGLHLILKLSAISLQACKFTKNELLHTYF